MKFSIIVPSYNQGGFIRRTLDSITAQQSVTLEILVFDGGSEDETVSILRSQPSVVRWVSRPDRGQTDAINQGMYQATGDILAYLNSDDLYYPGTLARVLDYFQTHPEAEMVYGNGNHIDANDRIIDPYYNEPWSFDRLIDICFLCQPAVFWRRSILEQFGYFDDRLHYAMDYDYWLRVGKQLDLHYLDGNPIAGSRLHPETKTLTKRLPVHEEILEVAVRHATRPPYRWLKTLARIRTNEETHAGMHSTKAKGVLAYVEHVLQYADKYGIVLDPTECTDLEQQMADVGL